MTDPYSGNDYVIVPPIVPDVSVIHAFKGDRFGSVIVDSTRNDRLLAMAGKKTIAVVEALVEPDDLLPGHHGVFVSKLHVDAVVVAPKGAHPTACMGHYKMDTDHLAEYVEAAKKKETFQVYLDKYILAPDTHEDYLALLAKEK